MWEPMISGAGSVAVLAVLAVSGRWSGAPSAYRVEYTAGDVGVAVVDVADGEGVALGFLEELPEGAPAGVAHTPEFAGDGLAASGQEAGRPHAQQIRCGHVVSCRSGSGVGPRLGWGPWPHPRCVRRSSPRRR